MATYYVSASTGSNTNNGLSASAPWLTLVFALGAASGTNPGVVGGDIIYVAPGNYNEAVTIGFTSPSSTVQILGDPLNLQGFPSVVPGIVNWFNSSVPLTATSKNNITFKNFYFESRSNSGSVSATNCYSWTYEKCVFASRIVHTVAQSVSLSLTINKCVFGIGILDRSVTLTGASGANYNINTVINDCVSVSPYGFLSLNGNIGGVTVYNCTGFAYDQVFRNMSANTTDKLIIKNTFMSAGSNNAVFANSTNTTVLDYCHRYGNIYNATETNTITTLNYGIDFGYSRLTGFGINDFFAPYSDSVNVASGTATGAPATDIYGVTWLGNPDIGAPQRSSSLNFQQQANPLERNASTITIAPGSTSQSIELYLGATGLTASTSGLSAYYNRTRSADVQINLQARNITQNWTSGGFAEVNPNTMPGVYRLDIPNEALAAGADDVTVVVRGASGTNGAVMSIKLSSGGLTTAQTSSAVWNALTNDHTTHGTFGWNVLRADQDSKEGLVTLHQSGGVSRVDADIHAVVNDTAAATALKGALLHDGTGYVDSDVVRISTSVAAANELEGALLHNGTDYIDANLLSGNSTRVFVGRFQMTQTGTTQGDIIEAFTTDTPAFELQLFDGDNNLVPVTGATLGLRILDVTSTVVETGTPTIEYGTGGIVRWTAPGTYLSIGCPAGMYRMFVDRTVSGTTTTFGPLQIKVQVQ